MSSVRKVVLAGCGGISRAWLQDVKDLPEIEMCGFVDIDKAAARNRATEFGWDKAVIDTDLGAVLERVNPEVVFDCTIPEAHHPVTMLALAHGCHVLGEKPMADNLEHAREMISAAQRAKKIYAVIQNRRYDTNIRRARQFIESGALGRITEVHSDFYIGAHFGGFRDHMQHVLLLDMAIHTFDAGRLLSGADPVSVYAEEWNPAGSWYDQDASAAAFFQMSGGIKYIYRGSWCAEGLNTSWNSDWRIIGDQGSLRWDGETHFQAQAVEKAGGFFSEWLNLELPVFLSPQKTGGHAGQLRDFFSCLDSGAVPETV
jgi:predicted dehydrogenase